MIPIKVLKSCRLQLNLTLGHLVNSSHVKTEDIIMSPKLTIVQVNNLLSLSISTPVYVYMLFAAHHHIEFATQSKNHQSIISKKKNQNKLSMTSRRLLQNMIYTTDLREEISNN